MQHLLLQLFLATLDILSIIVASISAIALRFEFTLPAKYLSQLINQLPVYVIIVLTCATFFRLYHRIWKYAGSSELLAICGASAVSSTLWYGYSLLIGSVLPRSIYILDGILVLVLVPFRLTCIQLY